MLQIGRRLHVILLFVRIYVVIRFAIRASYVILHHVEICSVKDPYENNRMDTSRHPPHVANIHYILPSRNAWAFQMASNEHGLGMV